MRSRRHCETVCELLYLVGGQYSGCAIKCANESVHNLSYFHEFRIRMDIALELVLIQVFFYMVIKVYHMFVLSKQLGPHSSLKVLRFVDDYLVLMPILKRLLFYRCSYS